MEEQKLSIEMTTDQMVLHKLLASEVCEHVCSATKAQPRKVNHKDAATKNGVCFCMAF